MACLILHGFTSSLDTVRAVESRMKALGLPVAMPVLRGHGTRPEDLDGVRWEHWLEDARQALLALPEPAVVVGHSMGGLLALDLAIEHPERVKAVVTTAPPIRFYNPLVYLLPVMIAMFRYWQAEPDYADPALNARDTSYRRFPTRTFAQLFRYAHVVRRKLPLMQRPLLILQSTQDRTVRPASAQIIYDAVASSQKEIAWFHRSRHEMLLDVEATAVCDRIEQFVRSLLSVTQEPALHAVNI